MAIWIAPGLRLARAWRFIWLAPLLAAGCVGTDASDLIPPSYRDRAAPIASKAEVDLTRYTGLWHEVARFPVPFEADCLAASAEYQLLDPATLSVRNTCFSAEGVRSIDGTAKVIGPGRLRISFKGVPVSAQYWILWVDEGYRTAVVGLPSGRGGWILNRDPVIPEDRLAAAREILDFNGYDVGKLVVAGSTGEGGS